MAGGKLISTGVEFPDASIQTVAVPITLTDTSNLGLGTGAVDSITTGDYNVGVGDGALTANTTGANNTATGYQALYFNTTGSNNTANGFRALDSNTTGSYNTANGYRALRTNTTASNNTANGYQALTTNTTGTNNTAVGWNSMLTNTTGAGNTAIGLYSLRLNTTGSSNVAVGYNALKSNTTGINNTGLGYWAGDNITTGSSNIIIGSGVDAPSATASNQLNIGNWIKGASGVITIPKTVITGGITGTASPTQYANSGITVDDGAATSTYGFAHKGAGKYLRIGLPNNAFAYFETDALGFNFNKQVLSTGLKTSQSNNYPLIVDRTGSTSGGAAGFYYTGSLVGTISVTPSATAYNTSSDYRLKELDVPMVGSIDRLKLLRPINFAWKVDGSRTDGFFAHEAQTVVPESVHGTKDAMKDEEYEVTPAVMDGDTVVTEAVMGTRSVPDYQGIDQSKLSPLTISALQEAITLIEQLTARVTELENA